MQKTLIATAVLACLSVPAFADDAAPAAAATPEHTFTANVSLTSEYIYRGIAQSARKPAIQGGFDYSHSSGLYAGVWGSSISWLTDGVGGDGVKAGTAPVEIDVYGGYKNTFAGGDWNYDVGVLTYNYPHSGTLSTVNSPNTTEVYGALGWKWLSAKYSYTVSNHIFGNGKWGTLSDGSMGQTTGSTRGSGYFEVNANYDLGTGWGLVGHVGHQSIKDFSRASYSDYKLGVTKDVGFGVVALSYYDTNAHGDCNKSDAATGGEPYCSLQGKNLGKGAAQLSFTKTF